MSEIESEARRILDLLVSIPFAHCYPLSRDFELIPARLGLYALRHRTDGLLYVGKTKNLRDRFRGGHKGFLWGWLDRYDPDDVRIAISVLPGWQRPGLSLELETLILQATNPPYNARIPRGEL
jgi:GIY-YIG catalytic domain